MNKREQSKLRMQKMRNKKSVTKDSVTKEDVTQYPAIIHALCDPIKREKLEKIYQSLKDFRQEKNIFYGCGKQSMPFDMVGEYLDATGKGM